MREKEIFADCFDNFFKEDFMNIDNFLKKLIKNIADKILNSVIMIWRLYLNHLIGLPNDLFGRLQRSRSKGY